MNQQTVKFDKIARLFHGNYSSRILNTSECGTMFEIEYRLDGVTKNQWINANQIIGKIKAD